MDLRKLKLNASPNAPQGHHILLLFFVCLKLNAYKLCTVLGLCNAGILW